MLTPHLKPSPYTADAVPKPPTLTSITLTPAELESKQLTSHHLQEALEALHRDGVLILNNAVSTKNLGSSYPSFGVLVCRALD
jgi:hypothetical protein